MHEAARARVLEMLPDDAVVLDVGGWAVPFPRADWMLDLMPYETRGTWGYQGDQATERFTADTWVQRDICDREPWPFADDQFDFVMCSHTLEDVRDPVWVCSELNRIGKAGYLEVPSRLEEMCWGFQGPWAGWGHHHWITEVDDAGIEFVFKHHTIHKPGNHLPGGVHGTLTDEQKISSLWWERSFAFRERIFMEPLELDAWFQDYVAAHAPPVAKRRRALPARRARG